MVKRVYNFNAGPATLPLSVLEKAQEELLDYKGSGMSIMETSHRAKEFDDVIKEASSLIWKEKICRQARRWGIRCTA